MIKGKTRESYLKPEPKKQPQGDPLYPRVVKLKVGDKEESFTVKNAEEHAALHPEDHAALHGKPEVA